MNTSRLLPKPPHRISLLCSGERCCTRCCGNTPSGTLPRRVLHAAARRNSSLRRHRRNHFHPGAAGGGVGTDACSRADSNRAAEPADHPYNCGTTTTRRTTTKPCAFCHTPGGGTRGTAGSARCRARTAVKAQPVLSCKVEDPPAVHADHALSWQSTYTELHALQPFLVQNPEAQQGTQAPSVVPRGSAIGSATTLSTAATTSLTSVLWPNHPQQLEQQLDYAPRSSEESLREGHRHERLLAAVNRCAAAFPLPQLLLLDFGALSSSL